MSHLFSSETHYKVIQRIYNHVARRKVMQLEQEVEKRIREIVAEEIAKATQNIGTVNISVVNTVAETPTPQKKKLDWSKVPVDTLVEVKEHSISSTFLRFYSGTPKKTFSDGATSVTNRATLVSWDYLYLAPEDKQPWNVWIPKENSVCPLPEGVVVKIIFRDGRIDEVEANTRFWSTRPFPECQIIAYKIVGLAEGYTY